MAVASRSCGRCGNPLTKARLAKRKRNCYSCEVAAKRETKLKSHDRRVTMNGFTGEDYWLIYEAQNRRCAVYGCRANGATKYLAVDHDHKCPMGHDPKQWCRHCVRGLCCSMHNGWLGKAGDNILVFESLADYLRNWPSRKVLL